MNEHDLNLEIALKIQDYICPICNKQLNPKTQVIDPHHILHNKKGNREHYPLFLDSPLNIMAVHRENCHDTANKYKVNLIEVALYERLLSAYKDIVLSHHIGTEENKKIVACFPVIAAIAEAELEAGLGGNYEMDSNDPIPTDNIVH